MKVKKHLVLTLAFALFSTIAYADITEYSIQFDQDLFFRGDNRSPSVVFDKGFETHANKPTNEEDAPFYSGKGSVSFSKEILAAPGFPLTKKNASSDTSYVYVLDASGIKGDQLGYEDYHKASYEQVNKKGENPLMVFASEWPKEAITRKAIPSRYILGAFEVKRSVQEDTDPFTYNKFKFSRYLPNSRAEKVLGEADINRMHIQDNEAFYNPTIADGSVLFPSLGLFMKSVKCSGEARGSIDYEKHVTRAQRSLVKLLNGGEDDGIDCIQAKAVSDRSSGDRSHSSPSEVISTSTGLDSKAASLIQEYAQEAR